MLMQEEINKGHSPIKWFARNECEDRSQMAIDMFPEFFGNKTHVSKVELTLQIVKEFFKISKGTYVNRRIGTRKSGPFTSIKVDNPMFPNNLKSTEKKTKFYNPLEALGVKIVWNKGTDSYLFHIR